MHTLLKTPSTWRGYGSRQLAVCIRRHQKHDYANYDQFAPNFDMTYKTTQCVSVPNLKLFRSIKTELWAKEVGEVFIILYGKMGWHNITV